MQLGEACFSKLLDVKDVHVWGIASPLFGKKGNLIGAIESIRDITDKKNVEEKLKYLSFRDSLTNLYNRAYFEEEFSRFSRSRAVLLN